MTAFWKNILGTVIAASIVADVTILFQYGERLARIETKLDLMAHNYLPSPETARAQNQKTPANE